MTDITKVVEVANYLNLTDPEIEVVEKGAYLALNVLSSDACKRQNVFNDLKGMPNGTAYKKEEFPERLHYRKHANIPQFIVLGNEGTYYNVCCFNDIFT